MCESRVVTTHREDSLVVGRSAGELRHSSSLQAHDHLLAARLDGRRHVEIRNPIQCDSGPKYEILMAISDRRMHRSCRDTARACPSVRGASEWRLDARMGPRRFFLIGISVF